VEKQERMVVRNSHTKMETRETNVAILWKQALTEAVMLNRLPATKLMDYQNFPLASRLGILHCIPEESFDMATVTIIDIGFMGLFPKSFMQILTTYTQELKQSISQTVHEFQRLTEIFVSAFIYRPITLQQVIQIILAHERKQLDRNGANVNNQRVDNNDIQQDTGTSHNIPKTYGNIRLSLYLPPYYFAASNTDYTCSRKETVG
jgi:hypothetical protein